MTAAPGSRKPYREGLTRLKERLKTEDPNSKRKEAEKRLTCQAAENPNSIIIEAEKRLIIR